MACDYARRTRFGSAMAEGRRTMLGKTISVRVFGKKEIDGVVEDDLYTFEELGGLRR